jgi:hypothetical protein
LPKDRTYCQTIENKTRSLLAVGLQSIGYRQLYNRVFALTGINLRDDDITNLFFRSEDADKLRKKFHRRKETVKITRMREFYQKLRKGVSKLKIDNAKELGYESGMMGPGGREGADDEDQRQKRCIQKRPCKHCGSTSHSRKTCLKCTANPKYVPANEKPPFVVRGTSFGLLGRHDDQMPCLCDHSMFAYPLVLEFT